MNEQDSGALDQLYERIETLRGELLSSPADVLAESADANRHYIALDLLCRDILLTGIRRIWNVPEDRRRDAIRDRGLPLLARLADECAPPSLDRTVVRKIQFEFHPIRNSLEHDGHVTSISKALEFLEAIETVARSISMPNAPDPPSDLFFDVEGIEIHGAFPFIKGQLGRQVLVAHGSKESPGYEREHYLEFWSTTGDGWERLWSYKLVSSYVTTVQVVSTRSATQEELLVWSRFGQSMGLMRYELIAIEPDNFIRLYSGGGSGAYLEVVGRRIYEIAGGRVTRIAWDGQAYVAERVIRILPAPVDVEDCVYWVEDGAVKGRDIVHLRIGERFRVVRRDTSDVVVRLLYSTHEVIEATGNDCYVAVGSGEAEITLIPNVYDWERALRIKVSVREPESS